MRLNADCKIGCQEEEEEEEEEEEPQHLIEFLEGINFLGVMRMRLNEREREREREREEKQQEHKAQERRKNICNT